MIREITSARRGFGKFEDATFIKLSCGHERGLGGHVLHGVVLQPQAMVGITYDCREAMCGRQP